jgi:hypothetical protein
MNKRRRGSSLLEFTFVSIPLIFALISIAEVSRAAWTYHTMAYAVNEGARYVIVHGKGCTTGGNTCGATVSSVTLQIARAATGLDPSGFNVTLYSANGSVSCTPLEYCVTNMSAWPPSGDNGPGTDIRIAGSYAFTSSLAMFWPGSSGVTFANFNFPAYSRQSIQY